MALKLRSRKCSQQSSYNENESESNNTNLTYNHKTTLRLLGFLHPLTVTDE